jgi:hypothetical protein
VSGDNVPCFGKGEWRFARFPDNGVPLVLRALKEAESEGNLTGVMLRIMHELAAYPPHFRRISDHWPADWCAAWERDAPNFAG